MIIIADRGYESYNNIAHCQEKKWNYIIRSKESYGIKYKIPDKKTFDIDTLFTLTRRKTKDTMSLIKNNPERYRWLPAGTTFDYLSPHDNKMYNLPVRIVRFMISDTHSETIFTNLSRDEFPPEVLKELYKARWGIETSFKELKYNIGLASFHSKKNNLIFQEIFSKLAMYNIVAMIAYSHTYPENKRINFAKVVVLCRKFILEKISETSLLKMISKCISPIRPGRNFQRNFQLKIPFGFVYRIS